ncbi:hypothetical protein FACS1894214_4630 [Planctomycetales bacterium]|nr:hypothetical protein FACS1894214_4630 [Planctomycetales bacterium]
MAAKWIIYGLGTSRQSASSTFRYAVSTGNTASAQPVPVIPALAETAIPPLQQAPLDAVILFNPAGKRSVVLPGGWTLDVLDEFSRFLVKEQQDPVLPFTIQSITANGNVVQNRAETTVRFVITTTGSQAVRIPLGMKEGILPFADSNSNDSNSDKGGKNDKNGQGQLPVRYSGAGSFQLITENQYPNQNFCRILRKENHFPKNVLMKAGEILLYRKEIGMPK